MARFGSLFEFFPPVHGLMAVGMALLLGAALPCHAQPVVPSGFEIDTVTSRLLLPVAMAFTPDGRLLVTEKDTGRVLIIKNDQLLPQPFVDLAVNSCGERGALGICVDPDFASNNWVYVFYTLSSTGSDTKVSLSVVDNRIVRFTASGDTALAGSETLIRSLPIFASSCFHNSGSIHFDLDGALLVTYGDGNFAPIASLDLSDLHGKMLRLDPATGQAAAGNFFANDGDPATLPEIWAYGLRNSFDFTVRAGTGAVFATENGPANDDEINVVVETGDYGWPEVEGLADLADEIDHATMHPDYRDPIWNTADSVVCPTGIVVKEAAQRGGLLGNSLLVGQCLPFDGSRRIIRLPLGGASGDSVSGPEEIFATGFNLIADLEFDSQDRLYVCTRPTIWRITLTVPVSAPSPTSGSRFLEHAGAHPSSGTAWVRYRVAGAEAASLSLVDVTGRRVRTLVENVTGPGSFVARWDGLDDHGRRVAPGVYFYRLVEAGQVHTISIVRIR